MTVTRDEVAGVDRQAHDLHRAALVIDTLAGGPGVLTDTMIQQLECFPETMPTAEVFREVERLQTRAFRDGLFAAWWDAIERSGVDVLSVTVGAWGDTPFSFRGAVYDLGEWHQRIASDERLIVILASDDLERCAQPEHTGILLGFQDCSQLEGDLRNVETFYGLGVRMIQLTYNGRGGAGCGCTEPTDDGLTRYGRDLIRELNDVGIIVDVSHCGPRTTMEAIECSREPVAVSHAGCAAVHPHARNKSDEILRALGEHGGYLGVSLVPAFLASRTAGPSVAHFLRHVEHALNVANLALGIGTDWGVEHSPPSIRRRLQTEASARGFRPGDDFDFSATTRGFETWAAGWPALARALTEAGLDDPTVKGVLGKNFVSFFEAATKG